MYFWLNSPQLAKERVASRVRNGGHNIPAAVIERRCCLGILNLLEIFLPIVDEWTIVDNSNMQQVVIAEQNKNGKAIIYDETLFSKIKQYGK